MSGQNRVIAFIASSKSKATLLCVPRKVNPEDVYNQLAAMWAGFKCDKNKIRACLLADLNSQPSNNCLETSERSSSTWSTPVYPRTKACPSPGSCCSSGVGNSCCHSQGPHSCSRLRG